MSEPSRIELCKKSWLLIYREFYTPSQLQLECVTSEMPSVAHTIQIAGKSVKLPRMQRSYGHSYRYSGAVAESVPLTPQISDIIDRVTQLQLGPAPNMCLVNWYRNGDDYIGPHSDDISQMLPGSPIYSLSWGDSRTFRLLPRKGVIGQSIDLVLNNGDLVIMGGDCQLTHTHQVPKKPGGTLRVNFTMRTFK